MINTNIYDFVNVLDKAADAANRREEILTNNIANVDTPNYKRKDVLLNGIWNRHFWENSRFQSVLQK